MSYGTNSPSGLQAERLLSGATWSGQLSEYYIASGYATSLFSGDPIVGLANGTIGIATAGVGNPITGVFSGCRYTANNTLIFAPYWPASTVTQATNPALAMVIDDPDMIYNIQSSSVANPAIGIALADLNSNADLIAGAGSTVSGLSGWSLDMTTLGTGATKQLKILRLVPVPGNQFDPGGAPRFPYNNVEVILNNDSYKGGTGTAGV